MDNFLQGNYAQFNEADFISDPFFQEWITHPNDENEKFWSDFMRLHPDKTELIARARIFLNNVRFEEDVPDETRIKDHFAKHLAQIEETGQAGVMYKKRAVFGGWLKAAAFAAGITALYAIFLVYNNVNRQVAIASKYGELKNLTLPDSSTIVLNGHSTIEYNKDWTTSKVREVWLKEGEGYFTIRHLHGNDEKVQPYERFIVHAGNLDIEVLGTSFDIRKRRGITGVVLQTGIIHVSVKNNTHAMFSMHPGEIVSYNQQDNRLVRMTTSAEDYTAWKEKKLILNNPTVNEIIKYLEDNFGKKILLQSPEMGSKIIDGPIMLDNLDDALFILSTVLNTDIQKKGNTLIIRPRK